MEYSSEIQRQPFGLVVATGSHAFIHSVNCYVIIPAYVLRQPSHSHKM